MVMQRGEIWWADLPEPAGSAPGYRRPVLVLQSDDFTRSRIQTVIVIVLTTNLRLAEAPGNVLIMAGDTGLPKDSVVNVSQIITVNKSFLTERVRRVDAQIMFLVEDGVRTVLGL
jgi:mRNA interferase MazF